MDQTTLVGWRGSDGDIMKVGVVMWLGATLLVGIVTIAWGAWLRQ